MRRIRVFAALAALLAVRAAHADQDWPTNQRGKGFQLDGLHAPQTSKDPSTAALRLGDVAVCAGIPWSIGVNGAFRCSVDGTDFLSPSTGLTVAGHAGLTLLGRSSTGTGNAGDIGPGAALQVAQINAAATAITWGLVSAASTSGIVANWPVANTRWYCVDGQNGSDSNVGYSDTNSADCGTKAKATLTALSAIFPRSGAQHKVVVRIADDQGGDVYTGQGGLQAILGSNNWAPNFPLIVATSTNSTSGSVRFAGGAADYIQAGFKVPAGFETAGYQVTGTPTTAQVQFVKVSGGGSPAFPSEPAIPLGCRFRFDAATATSSLHNYAVPIIQIVASDTLGFIVPTTVGGGLPVAPSTSDFGYVECPGLTLDATNLNIGAAALLDSSQTGFPQVVGVQFAGSTTVDGYPIKLVGSRVSGGLLLYAHIESPQTFYDETGTARLVGMYLATTLGITNNSPSGGGFNSLGQGNGATMFSGFTATSGIVVNLNQGAYVGTGVSLFNVHGDVSSNSGVVQTQTLIGGRTANGESPVRIKGTTTAVGQTAGLVLVASDVTLGKVAFINPGAHPAIALAGISHLTIGSNTTGSSGTDVGLDLTTAIGSTVFVEGTPTVTGTAGDVRLCSGAIISWATAAAGKIDSCGNVLYGPGTYPQFLLDPGSNGIVVRTALGTTTAGQLSGPVTTSGTSLATTLNLGAGGITGTLPLNDVAPPTGTGFVHDTLGAWDSAARAVDVSGADITNQLKAASFPALTGPVTTPGGSLATSLNLGAGGITGTLPLNDVSPPSGTGIATVTSSAWDATATTVSTGLTRNSGNLTADLSTGKSGGQSVVGGTATTDTLTIKATSATPASGAKIYMQTAFGNDYYDPVVGSWALGVGGNPISFFKSGAQAVYKSNGDYSTGTSDAHLFNLQTNGTTAISIDSSQGVTVPSLGGGGTLCVQVDNAGKLTVAAGACSSTSGITQLTGPVTAGPGSGSQATAINLGGGSITGTLALANEGAPTGTGFAHVASGAWDSAARAVDLSGADATGTLAAGHFPALTGPVTTTAGSLATSLNLGAGGITGQLPSTDVAGNANGVAYFNAIGELEGDPTLFSWDDSAKHLKLSTDNGSPFAGTTAGSILEFNNSNTGVGQTLMVWTDSTGTPDAAWIEAIGIVYFYTPGSQGFQVLNSIDNSVPIAGFGGTGLYLYGQGSGMGIGTVTSSAALEIGGSTSNTAILLSQAVTQNIAKVGGGLGILTTDAHSVVIGTNGTARFTIDSSGNETMSSLATGIVKSTSGTLGNASSSDITGAISWPTGILAGDSSSLTTVTIGFSSTTSGLDYAGTTLSGVAFVASGASHAQGMVPDPGSTAGTSRYLREDGWHAVHSAGMTVPYYMNGIANSTLFGSGGAGGWIQPGTSASISTLHIEAPIEYAVEQYRVVINVMLDTISAGAVTCAITKNGGGTSASATFAAGATGLFDSGLLNTSGAAAGDTFGVLCSSSSSGATGSVTAFVEMFLY